MTTAVATSSEIVSPPGPALQWINARLHDEPLSSIVYCLVWSCILLLAGPLAVIVLVISTTTRLLYMLLGLSKSNEFDPVHQKEKQLAVVITGCDSGFGKELTLLAAQSGYYVFAACLKKESFSAFALDKKSIHPVQVDVTSDADVQELAKQVKNWLSYTDESTNRTQKRVLHALVNNAGIGLGGQIDWCELEAFQRSMDVNYFGIIRCCQAMLPLMKKQSIEETHTSSRILNIVSVSGMLSAGTGLGVYSPSKHAASAFSAFLRREMKAFGIQVTTVNPSFHGTDIVRGMSKAGTDTWNKLAKEKREEYGQEFFEACQYWGAHVANSFAWKMEVVVDQLLKCLKTRNCPAELVIGSDGRFALVAMRMLPAWTVDFICDFSCRPVPKVMKRK